MRYTTGYAAQNRLILMLEFSLRALATAALTSAPVAMYYGRDIGMPATSGRNDAAIHLSVSEQS